MKRFLFMMRKGKCQYINIDSFEMPPAGREESFYRALWKRYYDTIAVEGRENPRCRMSHMPKRYWSDMTEFTQKEHESIDHCGSDLSNLLKDSKVNYG